jgi:hypothetical protein
MYGWLKRQRRMSRRSAAPPASQAPEHDNDSNGDSDNFYLFDSDDSIHVPVLPSTMQRIDRWIPAPSDTPTTRWAAPTKHSAHPRT